MTLDTTQNESLLPTPPSHQHSDRVHLDHPRATTHHNPDLNQANPPTPTPPNYPGSFDTRQIRNHHEPNPDPHDLNQTHHPSAQQSPPLLRCVAALQFVECVSPPR